MPRVLLLLPTSTYRTKAFLEAALKLDVSVVAASEEPSTLADKNPQELLTLDFSDPDRAARQARDFAAEFPIDAVIPVDEDTAVVSAFVAETLKLAHNSVDAAMTAKNKHRMRDVLSRGKVQVPQYW